MIAEVSTSIPQPHRRWRISRSVLAAFSAGVALTALTDHLLFALRGVQAADSSALDPHVALEAAYRLIYSLGRLLG